MGVYYQRGGVTVLHADCRDVAPPAAACMVLDPPWDDVELLGALAIAAPSTLVFTGPRWLGAAVAAFGPPAWVFTWDTRTSWQSGPHRPLQRTKQALWYGELDSYQRDAALWGDPPPARDHPSTVQVPLDGRRLTDLWVESHRHLRCSSQQEAPAGEGIGAERFARAGVRRSDPVLKHAKPVGWLRCLIGNTSPGGLVYDPCAGSGTTVAAAIALDRPVLAVDVDEACCEHTAQRADELLGAAAAA
jgi:hypothetical protein